MLKLNPARHRFDRLDVGPKPDKLGHEFSIRQQASMLWIVMLEYGGAIPSFADLGPINPFI